MANPNTPQTGTSGSSTLAGAGEPNEVRSFNSDAGLGRASSASQASGAAADDVIDVLNELIETSKDGEKGFALAAKDANDALRSPQSLRKASARAGCSAGASGTGARTRGNPDDSGSVKGAVHRGWVSLKAATTSRDAKAVLEECERGEDYAKAKYSEALEHDLPQNVRTLIERQYRGVVENHDRVRELRNQYRSQ